MAWIRLLSFVFNVIGALFLGAAVIAFVLGAAAGGVASSGDAAAIGALMGGMVGSLVAAGNFVASLTMFFFGAVLWGIYRVIGELEHLRSNRVPAG